MQRAVQGKDWVKLLRPFPEVPSLPLAKSARSSRLYVPAKALCAMLV